MATPTAPTPTAGGTLRRPWSAGRVPFATRSLLNDRVRLALSLGGVTFAVVLVLLLRAIMDGTIAESTAYIDHVGADVFVGQAGVTNMALASSLLPADTVNAVQAPEVQQANGIIRVNVIARNGADTAPAQFVGYPGGDALGGPWKLTAGRRPEQSGEAVIDSVLADHLGARMGDTVLMAGRQFRVVGISAETATIAAKFAFVLLPDAQSALHLPNTVSFVLVDLQPGADAAAYAANLQAAQPGLSVMTRGQLSTSDRNLLSSLFIGPINVMSSVGFLVGLAVVGLTMYTTTNERIRDFGVLKAVGAPNLFLFRVVLVQSAIIGSVGFLLGLAGTWLAGPLVQQVVPDIAVRVEAPQLLRVFVAVTAMSLVAAVVPVARILRVDPLLVFRR